MAPEIEKEVLPTPELNLNRIGRIIPLVIVMDRAVTNISFLVPMQTERAKIVRIFLKPQAKSLKIPSVKETQSKYGVLFMTT